MITNIYAYMLNRRFIIVLILLIAAFLRFNQLNSLPTLNADEAAIGYNAYSLIQTGKDEHGNPWPIHFESFGDWKPGLFFYVVLPFVAALGLNEWAVRIPGATLGVLTVLIVYLLVKELIKNQKMENGTGDPYGVWKMEILAAALLAVSPWHIHFSRGGWEVNAGTFFIVSGVWLFLKGIANSKYFTFCVLSFALSLYTYHSARIVVPLLALGLLFFYRRELWKSREKFLVPLVVGAALLIPLARDLVGPAGASRAQGISIFADPGVIERINEQRGEHTDPGSIQSIFIHNKAVNYTYEFLANWGEHFWGEFLFFGGDEIERNKVPEFGQLYLVQLPLLLIGLLCIARSSSGWGIILWWLIIAPTAAALTFQSPHALRSHNMVIPLTIISAYGVANLAGWNLFQHLVLKRIQTLGALLIFGLLVWDFTRYLHQYYIHMTREYPFSSQYGVKELVSYIQDNYEKYPEFIITDQYDQPYILFLYYMKYPPEKFQGDHALTTRDKFGFSTVRDFDRFHFRQITPQVLKKSKGALIAGTDQEIEDAANIIHTINLPNGKPAFQMLAN